MKQDMQRKPDRKGSGLLLYRTALDQRTLTLNINGSPISAIGSQIPYVHILFYYH
ncbi:hypothetical protein [Dictyobacter arantiisoli]|uniref:Uncharacterized protein n=1 Tax=Dictyobacter arantiisoli TaxID=2014874 RepID=A0A5A5TE98_9CHLR|nr:hypothetical protein [Dictyobacter arantiisoli]GCF09568.1 hypothetical protein KDI_31320 [Dictyobacter arantiisoli]